MSKKYYWLKLHKDFFKRHDIRIVESMDNGKDYVLFYLKLLVESISHNGDLRFSETIPYNDKMLSTITDTNVDIVRSAVKVFSELNLMETLEDGTIYMNEVQKMIGSETDSAERMRKMRERNNVTQQLQSVTQSKRKSIEKEKELDKEQEEATFKKPTHSELKEYMKELGIEYETDAFYDYHESRGWTVGKSKMKDWKSACRTWLRNYEKFNNIKVSKPSKAMQDILKRIDE